MNFFDIKGLSAVSVTYSKVLTDEDIGEIRNDFLLGFNRGYMEKVATNVVIFIVPDGMAHVLRYYFEKKPLQSQVNRESVVKWLGRINYVDDLQIVLQTKK